MYKKLFSITALSIAFISCVQPDNGISEEKQHIVFEDLEAKAVCVEHWDLDNDLEISYQEASYALITNEFTGNERLKTFPELIHFKRNTEISKEAFKGCTNLQQIAFGENITAIKEYAFAGCSSLKEIAVPNHIRDIEKWSFKGCCSLEQISLPDSITVIKEGTFAECKKLKYIDIPSSVTTIGRQAFIASGLESVNIFSNVEKIEESAFQYCDSLVKVYCIATTPPVIGHYPFLGCKALEVIFVPIESVETYKKEWYNYSSYIEGYTPSEDVVRINNEFISVAPEGMVLAVKVESNIPYDIIISNPEWIKQEQVTRGFLTSDTCYFCISANRTSSTRNAYIVFTSKDNGTISDTLRIIQESNICNLPYYESFENSLGKFTNMTISGKGTWVNDNKTAKATGYDNASQTTTAGTYYLISPEISLEGVEEAYIAYEYILRYNKGDENQKVLIAESTEEPEWTVLNTKHTEGRDWVTFETAELNIPAEYVGKTIRIAFYYNTNNVSGSTWEVRNFSIQEGKVAESGDDPNAVKSLPYSESFSSSLGSFVNETISGSGEWINDYQTAEATGYDNASQTTTAGTYYLISPQISLEGITEAHVAYEYILRYNKGDENQKVLISADYTDDATMASWAVLKADHTNGADWVTFESADINIPSEYMGKTIRIAFYYNTNNVSGSTWEVRNFAIAEGKASEGDNDDNEEPVEPEGDNLIGNGGFEAWSGSTPTNWKSTTTASKGSTSQSTDAHSGSYAVKVAGTTSANNRLAYKEITLKAGTYQVHFFTKAATANGGTACPGYAPLNDDGKLGQYAHGNYINNLSTDTWTEVSHEFTLSKQTTINLVIMCSKNPGADILVDDYTLTTTDGGLVGGDDEGGEEEENPGDVTYSGKYVKVTEFIEAGTYLLVNGDQAFTQLDATKTYGYMPAVTVSINNGEIAASAATEAAKLTIAATDGGYTLQDASARYIYMKGTYNSFNIGTTATESYVWTITANGDDTFSVTNADMGKTIMYDTQYSNFGCYPDKTDARLYVNIYKYIAE